MLLLVVIHDLLNCLSRANQVLEASHPHVALFGSLGAKKKSALKGLHEEAKLPVLGHVVAAGARIDVGHASERNDSALGVFLPLSILGGLSVHNHHLGTGVVEDEVAFGKLLPLEKLHLFNLLSQQPFHHVPLESSSLALVAVPGPELFVPLLDQTLALRGLAELLLKFFGVV